MGQRRPLAKKRDLMAPTAVNSMRTAAIVRFSDIVEGNLSAPSQVGTP